MARLAKALSAAAGSAGDSKVYVEDVFSTFLYTGNGSNGLAIDNGIDLAGEGGLVWIKSRGSDNHSLATTDQGLTNQLASDLTNGNIGWGNMQSFDSDGFTLTNAGTTNTSTTKYTSWTFRKQEGFFDIVTWTGNSTASRAISHGLNAKVGTILVKCTSDVRPWPVYHSGVPTGYAYLDGSGAFFSGSGNGVFGDASYNNIAPTTSVFYVGSDSEVNGTGKTYIAYVFAEGTDSGSQIFGDDGDEAIIKTGSFTPTGSGTAKQTINVGFEPQWLIIKNATSSQSGNWWIFDNMRGFTAGDGNGSEYLLADTSGAASAFGAGSINITNQGFEMVNNAFVSSSQTFVYMAIRRGPMKEPDAGTDVYIQDLSSSSAYESPFFQSPWPVDLGIYRKRTSTDGNYASTRLTGTDYLITQTTAVANPDNANVWDFMNGYYDLGSGYYADYAAIMFRRYPKCFDVVVYSGNATAPMNVPHNLGVAAELLIFKKTSATEDWNVLNTHVADGYNNTGRMFLNTNAAYASTGWGGTLSSATAITVNTSYFLNQTGSTYIVYLFATLAGISKVGTYTGTAADLNIDCGFSGGARFVMIKRTDAVGDWYVFDSTVQGINSGSTDDPYWLLNSNAADATNQNYISPYASGFTMTSNGFNSVNVNGGTYLFLAFA